MMNFTYKELNLIYDALNYYRNEKLDKDVNLNLECDLVINKLYSKVTINGIEPAYRSEI